EGRPRVKNLESLSRGQLAENAIPELLSQVVDVRWKREVAAHADEPKQLQQRHDRRRTCIEDAARPKRLKQVHQIPAGVRNVLEDRAGDDEVEAVLFDAFEAVGPIEGNLRRVERWDLGVEIDQQDSHSRRPGAEETLRNASRDIRVASPKIENVDCPFFDLRKRPPENVSREPVGKIESDSLVHVPVV